MENIPLIAFLAPLALLFSQVRQGIRSFFSFLWTEITIKDFNLKDGMLNYLSDFPKINLYNFCPKILEVYSKDKNAKFIKLYKDPNRYIYLYKLIFPVIVRASDSNDITIYFLRFTFPIGKIFLKMKIDTKDSSRFFYILNKGGNRKFSTNENSSESNQQTSGGLSWKSGFDLPRLSDAICPTFIKNEKFIDGTYCNNYKLSFDIKKPYQHTEISYRVMEDVRKWKEAESWYTSKGIRYFRGHLLHGKPGTGKSALILEICRELKLPLFIYDLSSFNNEDFVKSISDQEKAVILFEDFDCIFNGRENVTKTEMSLGLTFDCLINKISGTDAIRNKYLFVTTNNINCLDPAITRQGRCDITTELSNLNQIEKINYATEILEKDVDDVVKEGYDDNNAEFENRVVTEALKRYWNAKI